VGHDVIGMTNLQEAKLAREAEICYATLALVTDYDCWHPDHDAVTVISSSEPAAERTDRAEDDRRGGRAPAGRAHVRVQGRARNGHHHAGAAGPEQTKKDLAPIIGKYLT
jgi:5'-methylthioadenosine phosphorylase